MSSKLGDHPLVGTHGPKTERWWVWVLAACVPVIYAVEAIRVHDWGSRVVQLTTGLSWAALFMVMLRGSRTVISEQGVRVQGFRRAQVVPWVEVVDVVGPGRWDAGTQLRVRRRSGDSLGLPNVGVERLDELRAFASEHRQATTLATGADADPAQGREQGTTSASRPVSNPPSKLPPSAGTTVSLKDPQRDGPGRFGRPST